MHAGGHYMMANSTPISWSWLAPLLGNEAQPASAFKGEPNEAVWLPNEAVAKAWMEYVKTGAVGDATPPPAPFDVRVSSHGDRGIEVAWSAEADFESGIGGFIVLRDGLELAKVPQKPVGKFGRPLFQSMTYHDTPSQPLPEMRYLDASARPGEKHGYSMITVNSVGLKSKPSAAETRPPSPAGSSGPGQAAAPDFGPNVLVFDPSMTGIQARIDEVFKKQERSQFGPGRYAYLFKPGKYDLDVQVGFYMQVLGLGKSPDDVAITGAVRSKANWMANHNATCNFWRCVENLSVTPTQDRNVNVWAVSQATAMRRVHVKGDMNLWDGGWSSGGFLADCKIDGQVNSGSQQQWLSRNTQWGKWTGGSWNMVFVGTLNPPAGTWPAAPYTVIDKTPLAREKPYLFIDDAGRYHVMVPDLRSDGTQGITWSSGTTPGTPLPIDRFYLAHPGADNAASINAALSSGKHLLFTPGVYHLEGSIRVTRPGTVVLGLGYPTLVPDHGTPAMEIADVDGVKVGGILFEAGPTNSNTLVQVGEPGSSASHAKDPVFLYDVFCRAGGASVGKATCFLTIHSNDVVGDNFWLWRADHGRGAGWESNKNANGLIVNGDNVTIYGLFVEHCQEYQTIWNGNGGRVYFYQSEMPYDPPSQAAWRHGSVKGYASYKVGDSVKTHEAWGLGVYCVFYAAPVVADNAIETPVTPGVKMHHMVTIRLAGQPNSGINHVINGTGDPVISKRKATVD